MGTLQQPFVNGLLQISVSLGCCIKVIKDSGHIHRLESQLPPSSLPLHCISTKQLRLLYLAEMVWMTSWLYQTPLCLSRKSLVSCFHHKGGQSHFIRSTYLVGKGRKKEKPNTSSHNTNSPQGFYEQLAMLWQVERLGKKTERPVHTFLIYSASGEKKTSKGRNAARTLVKHRLEGLAKQDAISVSSTCHFVCIPTGEFFEKSLPSLNSILCIMISKKSSRAAVLLLCAGKYHNRMTGMP